MNKLFSRWKTTPESAKSAIVFVLASFIIKGVTFVTTPIFTRLMDPTQYGIVSTYNSWVMIIEVFALLGMTSAGVFNVGLNDNREKTDRYISSVLILCNIVTIIVFAFLFYIENSVRGKFILPTNLLLAMFINLMINPAQIFWITRQKYEYKYKLAFVITVISTVVSQLFAVICVKAASVPNLGEIKIWSTTFVTVLFNLPIYVHILIKGKVIINFALWKRILIVALPLIPHYLAQHLMNSADRIMISNIVSDADAGIYSVVGNIGMIASLVWASVNASLVPYTYDKINKNDCKPVGSLVTTLLFVYAIACLAIVLIAPEIMSILAPKEYYGGVYAIPPICCVAFLSALYNVYANIEFYYKRTGWISFSTMVATILNIIINTLLIPKYSYNGAAYATLASQIVLILMHYLGYKRCIKQPIYNNKLIALMTISSLVVFIILGFLYQYMILRYVIFIAIIIISIIKRKSIIEIFGLTNIKTKS